MHRIDGPGAAPGNLFTAGNPTTGTPATVVTDTWLNAVQEEVCNVITGAGVSLNKPVNTQLFTAIGALIAAASVGGATAASAVTVTDGGGYFAGGNVEAVLQEIGAAFIATVAASKIRHGIVALSTTTELTAAPHVGAIVTCTNAGAITYTIRPDSDLDLPIGGAIQLIQGGAGQITIAAGVGVTLKKSASFAAKTMNQEAWAALVKVAANTWRLTGQLEAV